MCSVCDVHYLNFFDNDTSLYAQEPIKDYVIVIYPPPHCTNKNVHNMNLKNRYINSKCGSSNNVSDMTLKNVGGVDYTYLTFITENYYNLAPRVVFMKDTLERATSDALFHVPQKSVSSILSDKSNFVCKFEYLIWHNCQRLFDFSMTSYNKHWDSYITKDFKSKFKSLQYFYDLYIPEKYRLWKNYRNCPVCYGGVFATTRERIHKVPLKYWRQLKYSLERGDKIEESHFMERMWAMLLSDPLPHYIDIEMYNHVLPEREYAVDMYRAKGINRFCECKSEKSGYIASKKLVVVCAMGKYPNYVHANLIEQNVFLGWDCIIFAYNKIYISKELRLKCNVVYKKGWSWTSFLHYLTPHMVSSYSYIHTILDDVKLLDYSPDRSLVNMDKAGGDVISPRVLNSKYNFMVKKINNRTSVPFIEIFATLFNKNAWNCFWSMLDRLTNVFPERSLGFGYDTCFQAHCKNLKFMIDYSQYVEHVHSEHNSKRLNIGRKQTWLIKEWTRKNMKRACVKQHSYLI